MFQYKENKFKSTFKESFLDNTEKYDTLKYKSTYNSNRLTLKTFSNNTKHSYTPIHEPKTIDYNFNSKLDFLENQIDEALHNENKSTFIVKFI